MDGIFLINKKAGMTSYDCIRELKKKFNTKKIGHAGTLDPFAEGLLVVMTNKATKLSSFLINENKTYEGEIAFGFATDTYDITGNITKSLDSFSLNEEKVKEAFLSLTGQIKLEVPPYSAKKVDGKKLYQYARNKIKVELPDMEVNIYSFLLTKKISENKAYFKATVSKGTYIRSLAVAVGDYLNIPTCLYSLKRTKSGNFSLDDAYELGQIDQNTKPNLGLKEYANTLKKITIKPYLEKMVLNGVKLDNRQTDLKEIFSVYNQKEELLAIYKPFQNYYKPLVIIGDKNENT